MDNNDIQILIESNTEFAVWEAHVYCKRALLSPKSMHGNGYDVIAVMNRTILCIKKLYVP
jgi:hypothetical protein